MQNETNNKTMVYIISAVVIIFLVIFAFWYFGNNEEKIIEDNTINENISTSTEDINNPNYYQNQTGTSTKTIPENNFDYKG
jgi:uncharacterized membrane protein